MTDEEVLLKDIKARYKKQRARIRRVIRKHGELSADKFDEIFGNYKTKWSLSPNNFSPPNHFGFSPLFFMLGSLYQGDWSKWLELTQIMMRLGEVTTIRRKGELYYKLTKSLKCS